MGATTDATPVIVEAAINGGTRRDQSPHVPVGAEEIAAEAVACLDAGAAIVHLHNHEPELWGDDAAASYARIARTVMDARPDALWYPTLTMRAPHAVQRNAHLAGLVAAVPVHLGSIDPGSTNIGWLDDDGVPHGRVYDNDYESILVHADEMARLGLGASLAIYEPGFLRTALALHRAGRLPAGSMVKLYFGGDWGPFKRGPGLSFGLPPTERALLAYLELLEGSQLPWAVSVVGGDTVHSPVARPALELGGHLHVGLEFHFDGTRRPRNVELVAEAVALAAEVGRPAATPAEAARILGLPGHETSGDDTFRKHS